MADTNSETLEILVKMRDEARSVLNRLNTTLKTTEKEASLADRALTKMKGGLSSLRSTVFSLKGLLAGLGVGLLAKSFLQASVTAEQYRTRLVTLTGSVKVANQLFKDMGDFASSVSFEYQDIMGSATNLTAVLKGGANDVKQYMPIIADLAAATGLSIEETTGQVIRMYSAGAAAADMFRERGVLAMLGFQAGVSTSAEETRKRLIEAWESPTSSFRGAAQALSKTWSGMMSMMSDAWFQFRNQVMDAGIFDFIRAGLSMVLNEIKEMKKSGDLAVWANKVAKGVMSAFEVIIKGGALVKDAFHAIKIGILALRATLSFVAEGIMRAFGAVEDFVGWVLRNIGTALVNISKAVDAVDFTGLSKGMTSALRNTGELLQKTKGLGDESRRSADIWYDLAQESSKALNAAIAQGWSYTKISKLLDRIKKKAEEYRKAATETARVRPPKPDLTPQAKLNTLLASQVLHAKELARTQLASLEILFRKGTIGYQEYYDRQLSIAKKTYDEEVKAAKRAILAAGNDPDKKLKATDNLFKIEQDYQRKVLALEDGRTQAAKKSAETQLAIETKLAEAKRSLIGQYDYEAQNQAELEALKQRQEQEIQQLTDFHATKNQIEETQRLHTLQQEKLLADQRVRIQEIAAQGIKDTLSTMSSAFSDAYEASGKKIKAFALANRAVTIANTLISTYEAAQKAYAAMVGIPVVGPALGTAAAAAAIAAGLARVSAIRAQTYAEGGEVKGYSPTPTSDNIPIMATANEFVQPVSTVKYYGTAVMEALRTKAIPREFLSSFAIPNVRTARPESSKFASGGSVSAGGSKPSLTGPQTGGQPITIVNVTDPQELDSYLASASGQDAILNVLSSRAETVRRLIR